MMLEIVFESRPFVSAIETQSLPSCPCIFARSTLATTRSFSSTTVSLFHADRLKTHSDPWPATVLLFVLKAFQSNTTGPNPAIAPESVNSSEVSTWHYGFFSSPPSMSYRGRGCLARVGRHTATVQQQSRNACDEAMWKSSTESPGTVRLEHRSLRSRCLPGTIGSKYPSTYSSVSLLIQKIPIRECAWPRRRDGSDETA